MSTFEPCPAPPRGSRTERGPAPTRSVGGLVVFTLLSLASACTLVVDADQYRVDAGRSAPDATSLDAGPPDAGQVDTDAGQEDAGHEDGGGGDAAIDGGAEDAGTPDTGATDTGASDAGASDGGPTDGGAPDSGTLILMAPTTPPQGLLEGWGSSPIQVPARAVPVMIPAEGLRPDAVVSVQGTNPRVSVVEQQLGADGRWLALAVRVAVDPNLAAGATATETLLVQQTGGQAQAELVVVGLDELEAASGTVDVPSVAPAYARVRVAGGARLTFGGAGAVRLLATESIQVDGTIDVSGGVGTAGPGGCAGGSGGSNAPCGAQGGAGGSTAVVLGNGDGGGGGGNRTAGTAGGSGRAAGQARAAQAALLPIDAHAGGGGGGGGNSQLGGGGGGAILLAAEASVRVDGEVLAVGGTGQTGGGLCSTIGSAGSAGGGAGGAIIVRAPTVQGTGVLDVRGGAGGPAAGCSDTTGGAGGDGFYRLDGLAALATEPPAGGSTPGPVWAADAPVIVRVGTHALPFSGAPSVAYGLTVDGTAPGGAQPTAGNDGRGSAQVDLQTPGISQVCLLAGSGSGLEEERHCLSVAVLP